MFMIYFSRSILTNMFRVILVLLQDYKGTNIVLCRCQLQIITILDENI